MSNYVFMCFRPPCIIPDRYRDATEPRGPQTTTDVIGDNKAILSKPYLLNIFQTVLHDEQADLRMEAIETEVVDPSQPLGDTVP